MTINERVHKAMGLCWHEFPKIVSDADEPVCVPVEGEYLFVAKKPMLREIG